MSKVIYLAGGCFWGMQKYFDQFEGVLETEVGYANGFVENPSYPDVKAQQTGHTETLKLIYDERITLKEILERYFLVIDPTSLNKQGEDEGTSYRTGIYWVDDTDESVVLTALEEESKKYDKPLVVEHEVLKCYYPAEEYHQKYLVKNPDGYCHIGGCFFENK